MRKYRIIASFLAGLLFCTSLPANAMEVTETDVKLSQITKLGDANADDTVGVADIVQLTRYLLQSSKEISPNADLVGDGVLNGFDLALLKSMVLGYYVPDDFTGLMINEVCASNQHCYSDADGREPDWLEIYNAAETAVDLSGYGLADGKKNLFKYVFPEGTTIAGGGYLLVCCDDGLTSSDPTEHHAPFKLSASGETMYLTHPNYGTLDIVEVPAAETDISYGRFSNGSQDFSTLSPTPGQSNDTAEKIVLVEAPVCSMESGFYDAAFDLTITADAANTIYYTTDGSDPTTSDTAKVYNGAISIYNNTSDPNYWATFNEINLDGYTAPYISLDKGMMIRAAAKDAAGNFSEVVTENYYINKTASYYQDMKVVSLTTDGDNLFDPDTGIYVIGNSYYAWKNSPMYDPTLEPWNSKNPTNYNQSGIDWERPATVQVFEQGQLAFESDIGIRISGNASRGNSQKSIRLYARSEYGKSKMEYEFIEGLTDVNGQPITTYDKITLRSGANDLTATRFRDELIQDIGFTFGMHGQGAEECILFINGEFWGLYSFKEHLDNEYLASHYGVDKDNVTYVKNGEGDGDIGLVDDYVDFYTWMLEADMTDPANYQRVCDTIDIENFMRYITIETYICNYDWCNPTWTNNWEMWRSNTVDPTNPYADGKWRFLMYDMEYACGLYGDTKTSYSYDALGNMNRSETWTNIGLLFHKLMENAEFAAGFYEIYSNAIEETFAYEKIEPMINAYVARQEAAHKLTNQRFFHTYGDRLNGSYASEVQRLKDFFRNRPSYAKTYLDRFYQTTTEEPTGNEMLTNAAAWYIYKGTASGELEVQDVHTLTINSIATGEEVWMNQAIYDGLTLEAGKTYQFTYTLRADATGTVAPHVQMSADPYTTYFWQEHMVTTEAKTYKQVFTMPETYTNTKVAFDAGYQTGKVYISDISLICFE